MTRKQNRGTLGVGIIGAGLMGGIHAQCFADTPGCRFVGCYNPTTSKAENLARKFRGKAYDSVASLLNDDAIDAVVVASPQSHHFEQAVAAARAGKHILCEKPLALTTDEMSRIAAAVKRAGVTFMVAHQMRLHPVIAAVKSAMPKLGASFSLDIEWSLRIEATSGRCWSNFRQGGFFMELGCHVTDLARYLMGPIRHVSANTVRMRPARVTEDFTRCLLQFDTFASGSIVISANHRTTRQGLMTGRILGERGRIDFTCYPYARTHNTATLTLDKGKAIFVPDVKVTRLPIRTGPSPIKVYAGFYDVYHRQARAFADAVRKGSPVTCSLEDGRSAVEVILAAYHQQHLATGAANFRHPPRRYESDAASHPALDTARK